MGNQFANLADVKDEIARAEYAISVRKYDLALQLMQEALSNHPQNAMALYTLGRVYLIQHKFPEAQQMFVETLRQNPEFSYAHMLYGLTLQNLKQYTQAEYELLAAIQLQPTSASAHRHYSNFLLTAKKDTARARQYCLKSLELDPEEASTYALLARIFVAENDLQQANEAYLQALRRDPDSDIIHNSYGAYLLNERRDPRAAFEHFRTALIRNPAEETYQRNFFLALKVKNRLYWLFWQCASLQRKTRFGYTSMLLVAVVLIRLFLSVAPTNSPLYTLAEVFIILYVLFFLYLLAVNPLFNLCIKRGWIK
jgi:Tfp pilus assembly protein PilF